jgi:shikimate dehydrogenase
MKRLAVVGHPVAHSLSPRVHAAFAREARVELEYGALDIAPEALTAQLEALHAEGWTGFNVTLPHKLAAKALCRSVSTRAEDAGAVNTLIRDEDGWRGDNTDGEGLLRDLRDNLGIELSGKRILLLGAGGAARGVIAPLLDQRPAELVVSNRNPWKPEALAEQFAGRGTLRPCTHLALKGDRYDLIINATSAGHDGRFLRLPPGLFDADAKAYDLSYGKAHTPFADWARSAGARAVHDGLGMLVEQAAVSFQLWHGVLPHTDAVISMLREEGATA